MAKAVVPIINALAAIAIRREAAEKIPDVMLRCGDEPGPVFRRFIEGQSCTRDSGETYRVPIVRGTDPVNLRASALHHIAKRLEHAPLDVVANQMSRLWRQFIPQQVVR